MTRRSGGDSPPARAGAAPGILFLVAWLAGVAAGVPAAHPEPAGTRLLPGGPHGVRFAVEVPEPRLAPLPIDAGTLELTLPGYDLEAGPGEPALPVRVIAIAVPPDGPVALRAAGSETQILEDVALAGMPRFERGAESAGLWAPEARALVSGAAGRARPGPIAPEVARLVDVSWMRNQRVARVAIAPATYEAARRRLSVHRRVEVELAFAPPAATQGLLRGGATAGRAAAEDSDPFETVYRAALVNYEQGAAWRRGAPGSLEPVVAAAVPETSLYAGRRWVKIAVPQTGFYKVEFRQVRNSVLFQGDTTTALDSLRLFTWPGMPVLPENDYCDACGFREVAIAFVENGNRLFSNNRDYFYFFAMGPSDWADLYDDTQPDTGFVNHPYETRNYYYLTVATASLPVPGAPRRIDIRSGALTDTLGASRPTTFGARIHHEVDSESEFWPDATPIVGVNPDGTPKKYTVFWEKWFWASLTGGLEFRETVAAPGIDPVEPARLRLRVWGLSRLIPGVTKSPGVADHYLDVSFGPLSAPRLAWDSLLAHTLDVPVPGIAESGNLLTVAVPRVTDPDPALAPLRVDRVGVAWFDLFYRRRFEPVGNELTFDVPQEGGTYVYSVGPFTAGPDSLPRLFDVTDALTPAEIVGVEYLSLGPGSWRMRFQSDRAGTRRYRIVPDARILRPSNADVFDAPSSSELNLRGRGLGADYLLIYYDGFRAAADSLLRWRRERLPLMGRGAPYDTLSVPISALYDQFSGGRADPGAIRNLLRAAFFNWTPRPRFVTFLGDASYDFKNLKGRAAPGLPGTLVPSYEGGFDHIVERQYASDDWMLNVDDPVRVIPDFFGGRIPAPDAASALIYVRDKLLPYERAAPPGEWRNRVMLIADDDKQGARPDPIGWLHLEQTMRIDTSRTVRPALPRHVDRAYVYLHTYPDGVNHTKPAAKADILRNLQEGAVMFNYIGHGSPFKIADESVLLDSDAGVLVNATRPSVFVAASCDVGKYNDPTVQSLGERLVLNPKGGCVAVISATELAFSFINAALNLALYREIFTRDAIGGRYETPLTAALMVAKTGGINNQKYQVMGDAAVRLALPRLSVTLTLEDSSGVPVGQARRGETLRFSGRLVDRPGGSTVPLNGIARILIEDSAPVDTIVPCFGPCLTYPFRAAPAFRGDVEVQGGRFEVRFVMPMDGRLGPGGRARAYVEAAGGASALDGVGSQPFEILTGSAPLDDREGPRIHLSFTGGATSVRPDAVLRVDLFDRSGILITGYAPQNGIIVTVDDNSTQRYDITGSFRYAANSYQSGTATFRLPNLPVGPHRIRVSAADNLATGIAAADHRSSATIDFEVTDSPALRVTRAVLFPNPVRSGGGQGGGQFVVDAPGDSVNVVLKIYTASGRLIRRLEPRGGAGQVQIPWDGLDAEGAPLARGVYPFRVQVFPRQADGGSGDGPKADARGTFVVVGP